MGKFGEQVKAVISAIAPTVGTALGGPFGGAAGLALQRALGTSSAKDTEDAILAQSPETLAKIKEAETAFKSHLADLGVQEDQLAFADTDSARRRETLVKDLTPQILAYTVTLGFFGILGVLLLKGKPPDSDVMMVMLGALGTAWTGIIGYYFGSSAGSASARATIAKLAGDSTAKA